jgi:hypothetical protein
MKQLTRGGAHMNVYVTLEAPPGRDGERRTLAVHGDLALLRALIAALAAARPERRRQRSEEASNA